MMVLSSSLVSTTDEVPPKSTTTISPVVYDTITTGGVAVLPNFLTPDLVVAMRQDAQELFETGQFRPDGLTNNALGDATKQGFQRRADRQTFRGGAGWDDASLGSVAVRQRFAQKMVALRRELARGLHRPTLATEGREGAPKHETTYNWYEPGAKLGRHLDEHHEETKGTKGWILPTRRSVTWLVYLNDNWRAQEGGALRCSPRRNPSTIPVGSHYGNLQVGWLYGNQPVFLDSLDNGMTALYRIVQGNKKEVISVADFNVPRQPIDFSLFLQPQFRLRAVDFQQISSPRYDPRFASASASALASASGSTSSTTSSSPHTPGKNERNNNNNNNNKENHRHDRILDVVPTAGTLVLFDSVTLPHLVQEITGSRQRIAATGWFHEECISLL